MPLPIFDMEKPNGQDAFKTCLRRQRQTTSSSSEEAKIVRDIVADVRARGDEAVVHYMRKWTDPDFSPDRIQVTRQELAAAVNNIEPKLAQAIARSIEHVRAYHQHIMPSPPRPILIDNAELGLRFTPVQSVGLTVPGGMGVLFSTLIMLATPAQVAGVDPKSIAVVNPPPTRVAGESDRDISPIVLATCAQLGLEKIYRIGGAQAVAALAVGTQTVEPVEMIAGPGNVFVQLAKSQVTGLVGTDGGFYGPSEIVTLADENANPSWIAADLIAQAEHDPGKCFLVSWSDQVIEQIIGQIRQQVASRRRRPAIERALEEESCAILVADEIQAIDVINEIAGEHVHLAVHDPQRLLPQIHHAGEIFLGHQSPVAAGDYYAGPSHTLPTGGTARFSSGISVYSFLKRTGTVWYRDGLSGQTIDDIARLAQAEGLDGHAQSVLERRD